MFFKIIVLLYNANWALPVCDNKVAVSPEGVIEKNWSYLKLRTNWNLEYSAHTQIMFLIKP